MQKEIYQILDGDSVLDKVDGREIKMPYLTGPMLACLSVDFGVPTA